MTLEELIETFARHGKESREMEEELVRQFQENSPNEPLPAWFKRNFNINDALGFMCSEILKLKERK